MRFFKQAFGAKRYRIAYLFTDESRLILLSLKVFYAKGCTVGLLFNRNRCGYFGV